MGYQLNSDAYLLFTKIEIGVREFLITLIKDKGVTEWTKKFLGQVHLDSLKVIGNRIYEANQNQTPPDVTDIYLSKIRKEVNQAKSKKSTNLLHPFYYLGWSDLIGVVKKSPTFELIGNTLENASRDILINNLTVLNFIRNDIAHSRFINNSDYNILKSSFEQITTVIPEFNKLCDVQTYEKTLSQLFTFLLKNIEKIEEFSIISLSEIEEFQKLLEECKNSFWLHSIITELLSHLDKLENQIFLYKKYRDEPGGLLKILVWKKENKSFLTEIKTLLNE